MNSEHSQATALVPYMPVVTAPPPPTPFDPGNWGEVVGIKTIANTRIPSQGPDTWRPLPHETFVTMIEQAFDRHGFIISEPTHYRAPSRTNAKIKDQSEFGRFLSMYGIAHPGLPTVNGITWEACFLNSYDMSTSARGGLGRRVLICSNGTFSADLGFRRKHTVGIDRDREGQFSTVFDLVDKSVSALLPQGESELHRINVWQNTGGDDLDARWVILEAAKKGVIGAAATMRVLEHWENPEHTEFKDRNVWSLENAFTSNDRGQSLMTQSDRFGRLNTVLDDRFGIVTEGSGARPFGELVAADF